MSCPLVPIILFCHFYQYSYCYRKAVGKLTAYTVESYRNNMLSNREIETKAIFPYRGATVSKKG